MSYLHAAGYPVPMVHELSDDGRDLVMERIDGPTMLEAAGRAPWRIREFGRLLGRLHEQLHAIEPPGFLGPSPLGGGNSVVHLDLHPLNVLVSAAGPVVIDWARAGRGEGSDDVAMAWLLMASAEIPGSQLRARVLGLGRSVLVGAFLGSVDRPAAVARLRAAAEWKALDQNMHASEIDRMRRLVDREAARQ